MAIKRMTKEQNDSYWAGYENGEFVARQVNSGQVDPAALDGKTYGEVFANPHRTPEGIDYFNRGVDDAILMDCGLEINVRFFG